VNSKQLRRSLKVKWLIYYRDNREWIDKLGIWITCDGQRRPSSSFVLGALSSLEPNLNDLLPLVVDLSSNPDRIIAALGLNISPDEELKALIKAQKMLPSSTQAKAEPAKPVPVNLQKVEPLSQANLQPVEPSPVTPRDEDCTGIGGREDDRPRQ
jgi:hypothetical protein